MAFFKKKPDNADNASQRRGGVKRSTQDVPVDISELEKRAAPVEGSAPQPKVGGQVPKGYEQNVRSSASTARMPAAARSARRSGRGTPIGELLKAEGIVDDAQIKEALATQAESGGLIGQILTAKGFCTSSDIANAVSKQKRLTQMSLDGVTPQAKALLFVKKEECLEYKLVPFEIIEDTLYLAMGNALNRKAIGHIERITKMSVKGLKCPWPEISSAIDASYTPEVIEQCTKAYALVSTGDGTKLSDAIKTVIGPEPEEVIASTASASGKLKKIDSSLKASMMNSASTEDKFVNMAQQLFEAGNIEDAIRRLETGGAQNPNSTTIPTLLEQYRQALEAKRQQEAQQHAQVSGAINRGRELRDSGDLQGALAAFNEAGAIEPNNNVVRRELTTTQQMIDGIDPNANVDREVELTEAAFGGESRLTAGSVKEAELVTFTLTPESATPTIASALATQLGLEPDEAILKLATGRIYARSLDELRSLEAAAAAVEASFADDDEEEVVEMVGSSVTETVAIDAEPLMEAEILEGDIVEGEILDAEGIIDAEIALPEDAPLTPISVDAAEFEQQKANLAPDQHQKWYQTLMGSTPITPEKLDAGDNRI